MKKPKKPTLIISVSGDSIALCNRCFAIVCHVICDKDNENCKVSEPNKKYTKVKFGDEVPSYCDKCIELLTYTEQ